MKLNLARTFFGIMFLAALVGLVPAAAQAHSRSCSQAGVAGEWGYTYIGTIILPTGSIPAAAVGRFTLDKEGNISGTQTRNVGGSVGEETIKGTGTVNNDCTATYKVEVHDGAGNLLRSAVLASVFVDNEAELRAIFASLVLPNGASLPTVITLDAKKLSSGEEN
jgi:hypothetical protein